MPKSNSNIKGSLVNKIQKLYPQGLKLWHLLISMASSKVFLGLIAIVITFTLFLNYTPAKVLLLVNQSNIVHLQGLSGKLWAGQGKLIAVSIKKQWLSLGNVKWQIHAKNLLTGTLKVQMTTARSGLDSAMTLLVHPNKLVIRDGIIDGNLRVIKNFMPRWAKLRGDINLNISNMVYNKEIQAFNGSVLMNNIKLDALGEEYTLGNLGFEAVHKDDHVELQTLQINNDQLIIDGSIMYFYNNSVMFDLGITPTKNTSKKIITALKLIAKKPDSNNRYPIKYTKKL